MSIKQFMKAIETEDTLGAILAIENMGDLNTSYSDLMSMTPLSFAICQVEDPTVRHIICNHLLIHGAKDQMSDDGTERCTVYIMLY